jgi:tripartite-type tricarboxylate transporter receptor subunit TctC
MKRLESLSVRMAAGLFALAAVALAGPGSRAQDFPSKPIKLLVAFPPGGSVDTQARILARGMEERLKSPVVVENRPGGNGVIASDFVAKADPDGYTLGIFVPSSMTSNFIKNPPFDVMTAFTPVAAIATLPLVLAVNSEIPATDARGLVAYLKANPGKINYGSVLAINHVTMALFQKLTDTKVVGIDYRGGAQLTAALLANETPLYLGSLGGIFSHIEGGKIRLLAVTGERRLATIPNTPTMAEAGFPAIKGANTIVVVGPANLPQPIVTKLSPVMREVVRSPEMDRAVRTNGVTLDVTPEEMWRIVRQEAADLAEAAKIANYQPQ